MTTKDNSVTINARWGELDSVIEWCSEYCTDKWDLAEIIEPAGRNGGIYKFDFENSGDQVLFVLRWLK